MYIYTYMHVNYTIQYSVNVDELPLDPIKTPELSYARLTLQMIEI